MRRYGPNLKLTEKRAAPDGKEPYDVAIDPSGRRVAVGYNDTTSVSILDAKTLASLTKAQTRDVNNGDLSSVAWLRDGATLVAGGEAQAQFQGEWRNFLRRFDTNGRRQGADVAVSANTILDIKPCGEGFLFTTFEPSFGVLSRQGTATTLQSLRMPDMREKVGSAFAVSPDASSCASGSATASRTPSCSISPPRL